MNLPARLQKRPFDEWNYIVRGLVTVWDLAAAVGLEQDLERRIIRDVDGRLTEKLARIGNECGDLADLLRLRALAVGTSGPAAPFPPALAIAA